MSAPRSCTRRPRPRSADRRRRRQRRRPKRVPRPALLDTGTGSDAFTVTVRPHGDSELTRPGGHGSLRCVTDTCVRLWRRVHMDLLRYAGCVCRPSC
ncbi:putative leader peptide [Streptomyces sp. NPDC003877]